MKMNRLFPFLLLLFPLCLQAQQNFHDPLQAGFQVLRGQAFPAECRDTYQRFPDSRQSQVPTWVWGNSLHSAGISLRFRTGADQITVRYTCANRTYAMNHMPAMGVSGVDLYEVDAKGQTHYCAPKYVFGDTITFNFRNLDHAHGGEYELYLPLYNKVTWLNVGVPQGADFAFLPASQQKPILVYGTSIAHGGCASRTGMAWPSILKRTLDRPFINWGFSGSGRLDSTMFVQMQQVDAALYIIDCMPNMTGMPDQIFPRLTQGIRMLRQRTDAPILLVEHDGYTGEATSRQAFLEYDRTNQECQRAYRQLRREGVKGLYYLSNREIAMPMDGMVDGVHATDYGMVVYANAYLRKLKKILK